MVELETSVLNQWSGKDIYKTSGIEINVE